jgi:ATP-dependent Clp protease ATP-binding subunit ClpB
VTTKGKAHLAEAGFDPQYGARPLKRTIQSLVQNPLAKQVLAGEIAEGDTVVADAGKDGIVFRKK